MVNCTNKAAAAASLAAGIIFLILGARFSAAYFSYAFAVFLIFVIYDRYSTGRFKTFPVDKKFFAGYILFYGSLLLASALNGDAKGYGKALEYMQLSLPFWMILYMSGEYDIRKGIQWGIWGAVMIACLYGVGEWIMHPGRRIFSLYAHPNHVGMMVEMLMPMVIYYGWRAKSAKIKIAMAIAVCLQVVCLFFAGSRGAFMGLAIGITGTCLIVPFLLKEQIAAKMRKYLLVTAAAAILVGGGISVGLSMQRGDSRGGERPQMIEASLEMWQDHPVSGVGLTKWEENYYSEAYHPADGREQRLSMPHNMFLNFLSTAGALGGGGYAFFVLLTFAALCRAGKIYPDAGLFAAIMVGFLAFTAHGMVDTTIMNKIPARMYYALLGYYLALGVWYQKKERLSCGKRR